MEISVSAGVVVHDGVALCSVVKGSVYDELSEWLLYIPHCATQLAACHRSSGVIINGVSAAPPRDNPKEVVKPVRSDEVAQMVAPTRFDYDSRSHYHTPMAGFRLGERAS
jgi:hypothetical protein